MSRHIELCFETINFLHANKEKRWDQRGQHNTQTFSVAYYAWTRDMNIFEHLRRTTTPIPITKLVIEVRWIGHVALMGEITNTYKLIDDENKSNSGDGED